MAMFLTGDCHNAHSIHKLTTKNFPQLKDLTPDDVILIAGDFGFVWGNTFNDTDLWWLNWMSNLKPKVAFVAGNHENYNRLLSNEFPIVNVFNGEAKQIYDNVFMLQTGHIYEIDNKKLFAFGGGMSIDKAQRIPNVSWWEQEIPNYAQVKLAFDNLASVGNKVDIIFSHATHDTFYRKIFGDDAYKENDPLHKILEEVKNRVEYNLWVCGHYHYFAMNKETKSICLYNEVKSYNELMWLLRNS